MSIKSARLLRARRRLRGYFFGSGVVLAMLYIVFAAFLVKIFGIEVTRYWWTLLLGAGVMLAGTYAIVMLVWIGAVTCRRLMDRQPIWDNED